jgi:hypothetical protein
VLWADSAPTRAAWGTTAVRAIAVIPFEREIRFTALLDISTERLPMAAFYQASVLARVTSPSRRIVEYA